MEGLIIRPKLVLGFVLLSAAVSLAQQQPAPPRPTPESKPPATAPSPSTTDTSKAPATPAGITPPPDYVIGPQDVLSIVFWRDKDMSADVTVRPDGKISLPLLNEIQAAGYTPEQLRTNVQEAAGKFVEEPNASVVVREIHSRNVYVTGNVAKPGTYSLIGAMNVLQLIAMAGGVLDFADSKHIQIIRNENGKTTYYKFNYAEVLKQKRIEQNIVLKSDDTVVVP